MSFASNELYEVSLISIKIFCLWYVRNESDSIVFWEHWKPCAISFWVKAEAIRHPRDIASESAMELEMGRRVEWVVGWTRSCWSFSDEPYHLWHALFGRVFCPNSTCAARHDRDGPRPSLDARGQPYRCRSDSYPVCPMSGPIVVEAPTRRPIILFIQYMDIIIVITLTFIRTIIFKCPCEYCSITSRTS